SANIHCARSLASSEYACTTSRSGHCASRSALSGSTSQRPSAIARAMARSKTRRPALSIVGGLLRLLRRCDERLLAIGGPRHPPQPLVGVPDREREHRLGIGRIGDVDEIVLALRVVDRLDSDAELPRLGARERGAAHMLGRPFLADAPEQNELHGVSPCRRPY